MKNLTLLLALIILSVGCARSRSSDLMGPPVEYHSDGVTTSGLTFEFNPKVDILFVVDNSGSMKEEQTKLQQAADLFVDSFGSNSFIDYHVGIITVSDSTRCGNLDKKGEMVKCYPAGKLQPLKGGVSATPFVTRSANAKDILRASLNVGTLSLAEGGPEFEEMFSPILKTINPSMNKENGGFIREGSRLVVIMVSDEDDSSTSVSEDSFIFHLDQQIGAGNYDLYGVVAAGGCARNSYADAPDRITHVVQNNGGQVFKICDASFGSHLAKIGSDIKQKIMHKEIVLKSDSRPEAGTLVLKYGNEIIPYNKGWSYDPRANSISINENIKVNYNPSATFSVQYTRINNRAPN